ncbi:hypothetical protein IIM_04918 [Bacillus cereus VD107]|nr:hypothetical protein IIM_04918 [Bacillus cereus VD107]
MSNPSIGESDIESTSEAVIQLNIRSGLPYRNSYRFMCILER